MQVVCTCEQVQQMKLIAAVLLYMFCVQMQYVLIGSHGVSIL